jgi:hypothetical protein
MNGGFFSAINSLVPQLRADVYPSFLLLTQVLKYSTKGQLTGHQETDKYRSHPRKHQARNGESDDDDLVDENSSGGRASSGIDQRRFSRNSFA